MRNTKDINYNRAVVEKNRILEINKKKLLEGEYISYNKYTYIYLPPSPSNYRGIFTSAYLGKAEIAGSESYKSNPRIHICIYIFTYLYILMYIKPYMKRKDRDAM